MQGSTRCKILQVAPNNIEFIIKNINVTTLMMEQTLHNIIYNRTKNFTKKRN